MKRIESKRPSTLGRLKRANPGVGVANFTPSIEKAIITKAENRAIKDGFPYFRDVVLVLLAVYGNGALSARLRRDMSKMITAWTERGGTGHKIVKRNYKIRKDVYDNAVRRWRRESPVDTSTAMFAFLLDSYGNGEIELALRKGKVRE